MKRIFPVLVAVVLSVTTFTGLFGNDHFFVEVAEAASGDFGGGDGIEGNPYQIEDVWDLQNMTSDLNAHYVLVNDIDATITSSWNGGAGFKPIGNGTAYFNGTFDGNGYKIYNLTVNRSAEDYVGLFGYLNQSASIENIDLENVNMTGHNYVAGLTGWNYGIITNCYSTGNASGNDEVGGFAGYNVGTITNCYSTGNASGRDQVGGFSGYNVGTINNCYSAGNATGIGIRVGGLAGFNDGPITNCYSTGNASGYSGVGGFIGYNSFFAPITNCFSTGNASGDSEVGGFAGLNKGPITNCYSTGNVSGINGINKMGGFAGDNVAGTATDCFWDTTTSGTGTGIGIGNLTGVTGKTTAEMIQLATFNPPWDFIHIWGIVEDTTYPFLTTLAPIVTAQQATMLNTAIEDMLYTVDFEATLQLIPDHNKIEAWTILSNASSWLSLNPFTGVLSGTPTNANVGIYYVDVSAVDSLGSKGCFNYVLTVMNTAPEITTADITEVVSRNLYYNDYDSTDDSQGTITWDMETNATWLNPISTSGTLTGIPSNDDAGTYWVYISIDDGNGGTDSTNFTLEVKMDSDLDGIPDDEDDDDDNDNVVDVEDDFPLDPTECLDTDGDGTGNNADTDDDGDGWLDDLERTLGTDPLNNMSVPSDMDGDDIADLLDNDMDGDGHSNGVDAFPEDPGEWLDSDRDGVGDNSDEYPFDMDNDGHNDTVDAFPMDPTRWETPVINNTVYGTQVKYYNRTVYNNQTIIPPMGDLYLNDTDGDGMPDSWELLYGLDPEDPSDASLDPDEDGISNLDEYKGGTSPTSADVEASDAGDESETPVWAWIAVAAAVILAVIVIILLMGRGGKKEELEGSGEYPEENDTEGGREE